MANSDSADNNNNNCIRCFKSLGTFTCRGCGENYCMIHANEHRQLLLNEMDENIIPLHDHLHENIFQQIRNLNDHPLMEDIQIWENNSIQIIHQTANQLRKDLVSFIQKPIDQIKQKLEYLTEELKKARINDQFFENDLKEWINQLNLLSNQLKIQPIIDLQYSNDNSSLIPNIKIYFSNERFQQSIGNINIIENGSTIVHNDINTYASVRGLKDYYQGEYIIHFQILNLTNNWIFIGIISKDSPIPDYPSIGKTAYGWSGLNNVWRDGIRTTKLDEYISDFQNNDQIDFIINCDQKIIYLINQRTNLRYHLNIDINYCPLPWKLSIGFYNSHGESIRIIQ